MTLRNPTLYVKIGNRHVLKPCSGIFYIELNEDTNIDAAIRTAKAQIQSSSGLDINRANIYVIANAHCPQAAELTIAAGRRLHALFAEDFAAFHITLVTLLDESNEPHDYNGNDYNLRNERTYKFLASLTDSTPFNRIFLFSNRNEYGRVAPLQVDKLLAHLPFLHAASSQFESTINMKSGQAGRVLFASAGLGMADEEYRLAVEENAKNRALHYLAHVLEKEVSTSVMLTTMQQSKDLETPGLLRHYIPRNDEQITASIAGVASRPVSPLDLNGVTVKEAESLLFGEDAMQFYNRSFVQPELPPHPPTLPLRHAAAEESHLRQAIGEIKAEISHLSDIQSELSSKQIRLLDLSKPIASGAFAIIDNAKTAIGRYYAMQYKLDRLNASHRQMEERHTELYNFLEYMRQITTALKALPTTPPQTPAPELLLAQAIENAALNISLLRTDGLITEAHVLGTPDNPYVLRVIGGFALEDLTRYNAMREINRYENRTN